MKVRSLATAVFVISISLILIQACASSKSYRMNAQSDTRIMAIKTPGLLPVDVKVYELDAGGIREQRDEWSAEAKKHIHGECMECFAQRKRQVEPIIASKDIEEELEDIQALYRAVSASIILHTYMEPNLFPDKVKYFDYTLGPIHDVLAKCKADALIFVYAQDEISTAGRQALMATGVVLGALTGIVVIPRGGVSFISVAVVDSSGDILWFNVKGGAKYDLRKPDDVKTLMAEVFSDFPMGR